MSGRIETAESRWRWYIVESPAADVGELPDPTRYLVGTVLECPNDDRTRIRNVRDSRGAQTWELVSA